MTYFGLKEDRPSLSICLLKTFKLKTGKTPFFKRYQKARFVSRYKYSILLLGTYT